MQKAGKVYRIEPAERVKSVEEYYFSRKLKEVAEMNVKGRDVINLGVGSPDLPPLPAAIEALRSEVLKSDAHGYQPYVGIKELRQGYSAWYKAWYGVGTDYETEVLPLIGSKEGVIHVSLAFLNPGDGVLTPNPGYPTYTSASKLVGARILPYELKASNGWYPDFAELEGMNLEGVKLMWVNYPNMPTGADARMELFEQLVDFGRRHGIVIVNDNPYSFILNDNPLSILSVAGAKDVCIELNSLSKSHSMAGWRMAMLISNAEFVQWVLKVKSNMDSGQFKPMQLAAVEALKAPKAWYDEQNRIYGSRRVLACMIMDALGCTYDVHQVGMFLWGRLPEGAEGSAAFADRILYGANVFITPGMVFGSCGERYVRISLCCREELLKEALRRINEVVEK
ncbi:MAG: aminotransferase class I/II-fold pyridoxal phosphate-dependent enzyme [Tannerellaceae bacterium]|jgi:aspartate/methionine/tyrosine aminotransferase|nr:aminotransferase class I/II-fold pyridoxal phosphate-dependent enzyme [Tannerellaceae bacterium]